MKPLVSVIMPAYNASQFIGEAIGSVLRQSYNNWELLIVNDGSTDETLEKIKQYDDNRIKVFSQENKGVSAARNVALSKMQGDYFCFLDADDVMPPFSLETRLGVFYRDDNIAFADGKVEVRSLDLNEIKRTYLPSFRGYPRKKLVKLSEKCFFGVSWMIRNDKNKIYHMKQDLTHGEDLLFYIEIADQGLYDYSTECVLINRQTSGSAMSNLEGLLYGYKQIYREVRKNKWAGKSALLFLKLKISKIMFLSFLKKGKVFKALKAGVGIGRLESY